MFISSLFCAPMMDRPEKKEIVLFAIQSRLKSFVITVSFRCLIVSRICESERDAKRGRSIISRHKCVCVKFNRRNTGDVSQSKLPIFFIRFSFFFSCGLWNFPSEPLFSFNYALSCVAALARFQSSIPMRPSMLYFSYIVCLRLIVIWKIV